MRTTNRICLSPILLLMATAAMASPNSNASETAPVEAFLRDREAILNLAGRYRVRFRFRETIPLRQGYRLREPFNAGGTEVIKVIDDEGDRIELQHFLLVEDGSRVIKHWRQVWTYEDRLLYRFRGNRTWTPHRLSSKQAEGHWSWAVFQVGDSPRYETHGSFTHRAGVSSWESRRFWRPLPRRERKKRDDYDVMGGRHRLTITDDGWYHEQDNAKIVLKTPGSAESVLVREVGLNTYSRAPGVNEGPVDEYWRSHRAFWEDVRSYWKRVMGLRRPIRIRREVQGDPLWRTLFRLAEQTDTNLSRQTRVRIHRTIDRYRKQPGEGDP